VNRGRYVVENYPQTPAVGDALAVMTQGYLLLGKDKLAQDSLDVLRLNYPKHPSLDKNGNFKSKFKLEQGERSWLNILTLGVFDRADPPKFDNRAPYLAR
jgi:outer membrane protein assembly factor BamD